MLELLLVLGIIFAIVWTRMRKDRVGSLDDFMDLAWLFPSRRRRADYEEIRGMVQPRGVCSYRGQVSPWSHRTCQCTGYVFKRNQRGTPYCECGCMWKDHKLKMFGRLSGRISRPDSASDYS